MLSCDLPHNLMFAAIDHVLLKDRIVRSNHPTFINVEVQISRPEHPSVRFGLKRPWNGH